VTKPESPSDDEGSDLFDPEHLLLAVALARGASHAAAGLEVGRSAKTVQRALQEVPGLREYVRELKARRASEAAAALGNLLPEAVAAAQRGLTADRPADQIRASALVFAEFRNFQAEAAAAEQIEALQEEIAALKEMVTSMLGHREEAVR
jgi:hypothetical protein